MMTGGRRWIVVLVTALLISGSVAAQQGADAAGVGIVMPELQAGQVLRLYSPPDVDQMPDQTIPTDSVTIVQSEYGVEIGYAPPWFAPELVKLDYELLHLRARTLTRYWIEVVVNQKTGETRWVDRQAVRFAEWPTFLLEVFAVEVIHPNSNPVRARPDKRSPVLSTARASLRPLAIQGDWMQVSTDGLADKIVPTGWIRWRDGNRLLVEYSLLS
jgi:hypothetical protein